MGIKSHKMAAAEWFTVGITGTCLKARGSVGETYVNKIRDPGD